MKIEKRGEFFKVDEAAKVAYGWAIVCTDNGKAYVDLQGDHIPEDVMLEAATEFAENSRVAKDMHAGEPVGEFPFIYPVTKSSKDLGIDSTRTGLLVGFKPSDPALLDLIKQGKRTGFSIGGVLTSSTNDEIGKTISKAAGSTAKTMRTFRTFKINEISLVDVPAQEGATVGYVKRAVLVRQELAKHLFQRVLKEAAMTDETDGHQHVLDLDDPATSWCSVYSTSYQTAAGSENGHSHSWTFSSDGTITIGADSDHTHTLPAGTVVPPDVLAAYAALDAAEDAKNAETAATPTEVLAETSDGICAPVTDEESSGKVINVVIAARAPANKSTHSPTNREGSPMANETDIKTADLTKRLERAERIVKMSGAHKAHFDTLTGESADAFLAKSVTERDGVIAELAKRAEDGDKVIYVSKANGDVFRAKDDPRMVEMAKREDAALEKIEKSELTSFAKANMNNIPGDDETHAYIVKSIRKGGGSAELIAKAEASIKGANTATKVGKAAPGFNHGTEPTDDASPQKRWDAEVAKVATENKVSVAKATDLFAGTEAGKQLYAEIHTSKRANA